MLLQHSEPGPSGIARTATENGADSVSTLNYYIFLKV